MNAINGFPLDPARAHLPADIERDHIRVKAGFLSPRDGMELVAELLKDISAAVLRDEAIQEAA